MVNRYPTTLINELNSLLAPFDHMIDGSVDDTVANGVAADVSPFIITREGPRMSGAFGMLLRVGPRISVDIESSYNTSKPDFSLRLSGDPKSDARLIFSKTRNLLNLQKRVRANPFIARFDARKLINKLNRNINTNADIKHDPATALETIFLLGITIGKMDELDEAATARDKHDAELAINRIAGFYEHLTG
jgi:hypothetical protein